MRLPVLPLAAGVLVAAAGTAGLVRGIAAQTPPAAGPIVVTGAYVRAPVPPSRTAAAYFTLTNTSTSSDRLLSVQTSAGAAAVLHTVNADGSMSAAAGGVLVHPHSTLVLATGEGHVMIQHVYGTLAPGQRVELELDFEHAGAVHVVAPVIAVGAPAPGAGHR
jgi:copper(I)-binding protein